MALQETFADEAKTKEETETLIDELGDSDYCHEFADRESQSDFQRGLRLDSGLLGDRPAEAFN